MTGDHAQGGPQAGTDFGAAEVTKLIVGLSDLGAVKFGDFTLKSGAKSPVYLDLRLLVSRPRLLRLAALAYARVLAGLSFDRIAAIPYAGLPLGTAVALEIDRPLVYPRKETKGYGMRRAIEGLYEAGDTVVVLDDLISDGGSKLEAIEPLTAAGLVVGDVVVLVDRESGGAARLADAGLRLHSVFTISAVVDELVAAGHLEGSLADQVRAYLQTGAPEGHS